MRGRDAGTGAAIGGVLVDHAPERLPDGLEFGLDKSDGGGLGREDALVEVLFVLLEERF